MNRPESVPIGETQPIFYWASVFILLHNLAVVLRIRIAHSFRSCSEVFRPAHHTHVLCIGFSFGRLNFQSLHNKRYTLDSRCEARPSGATPSPRPTEQTLGSTQPLLTFSLDRRTLESTLGELDGHTIENGL